MLLLAVDTSGRTGSLALAIVTTGQSEISVLEVVPLAGGAFSAQLVPQIAALLKRHGRNKNELGAFAVVNGPGSFTGLRVGLAAIKALAEVLRKPIATISLLEAVACGGAARGRVLAALDAGRREAYVGDYELNAEVQMHSERLLSRKEFVAEVKSGEASGKRVATPDAALVEALRTAGIEVALTEHPNIGRIAQIGWEHLLQGKMVRPEELEANYIRHTDAEIFSKSTL